MPKKFSKNEKLLFSVLRYFTMISEENYTPSKVTCLENPIYLAPEIVSSRLKMINFEKIDQTIQQNTQIYEFTAEQDRYVYSSQLAGSYFKPVVEDQLAFILKKGDKFKLELTFSKGSREQSARYGLFESFDIEDESNTTNIKISHANKEKITNLINTGETRFVKELEKLLEDLNGYDNLEDLRKYSEEQV